ncbi:MAG: hypothetical protein PHW04_01350 [Candidatus Wallbacteria bacterium]|nr:hypothetical protein [Candidatus Wallbacteria bacterium]
MTKKIFTILALIAVTAYAQVTPTMMCMNALCYVWMNGSPAPVGTVVKFVDNSGKAWGQADLKRLGAALIPVYGQDPMTPAAPKKGDLLKIYIGDVDTGKTLAYEGEFQLKEISFGLGENDKTVPYVVQQTITGNKVLVEFSEPVILKKENVKSTSPVVKVEYVEQIGQYSIEFEQIQKGESIKLKLADLFGNPAEIVVQ